MSETLTLQQLYEELRAAEYETLSELKDLITAFSASVDTLLGTVTANGVTTAAQFFQRLKSTVQYSLVQDIDNVMLNYAPAETPAT